jgi:hypothetical protein
MLPANDEKWPAGIEKCSRNRMASAVPTSYDEIPHKTIFSELEDTKVSEVYLLEL